MPFFLLHPNSLTTIYDKKLPQYANSSRPRQKVSRVFYRPIRAAPMPRFGATCYTPAASWACRSSLAENYTTVPAERLHNRGGHEPVHRPVDRGK